MTEPETIVCKPTPWFLLRAVVMLLMFSVFAVLFYKDGSVGYRKKNQSFYLKKTFEKAGEQFAKMNDSKTLSPEEWRRFAESQSAIFPEDHTILPANLKLPMPWPTVLHDYDRMKPLQTNLLWLEYSGANELDSDVEHPYDAGQIREQWIVLYICAGLAAVSAFFLLRTINRSISADGQAVTTQQGKRVPFADLKTLDLRKWETKGLAFIDYDGASGKGRIRVDGLTYGGFKKENGEPAERLMQRIREHFSGEVIEYASIPAAKPQDEAGGAA